MDLVPVRLQRIDGLPRKGESSRAHVESAEPGTLEIDDGVFEILSYLSGETMSGSQREALLPTLSEFLAGEVDTRSRDPLSQSGALGAILGVVHFALRHSERLWFTQLPREDRPTPDIFAVSERGELWNLEAKGVAPHSGEFPRVGQRIDICQDRIRKPRDKGRDQLESGFVVPRVGGPSLRRICGVGGRALAVTVVPDGRLVARRDLVAAGRRGCPRDGGSSEEFMPCTRHCLAAASTAGGAAVVSLLWEEAAQSGTPASPGPPEAADGRRIVAAVHAAMCASWARSTDLADGALAALTARIDHLRDPSLVQMLSIRVLQLTRGVASVAARELFAGRLMRMHDAGSLHAEVRLGVDNVEPPVALEAALTERHGAPTPAVRLGELSGRLSLDGLRLAPPLSWIDDALVRTQDTPPRLLDRVEDHVHRELFRDAEMYVGRDVRVRSGGESSVVGRRFGDARGVPRRLPCGVRAELRTAWLAMLLTGRRRPAQEFLDRHRPLLEKLFPEYLPPHQLGVHPFWSDWLGADTSPFDAWISADGRVQIR